MEWAKLYPCGLSCSGELLGGLDPDDSRDNSHFKAAVGSAEKFLHRLAIEPAADLFCGRNGEVLAGCSHEAAALELVLEGFGLGFGALQDGIGMAERVCKRSVGEIVESRRDIGVVSLSHDL